MKYIIFVVFVVASLNTSAFDFRWIYKVIESKGISQNLDFEKQGGWTDTLSSTPNGDLSAWTISNNVFECNGERCAELIAGQNQEFISNTRISVIDGMYLIAKGSVKRTFGNGRINVALFYFDSNNILIGSHNGDYVTSPQFTTSVAVGRPPTNAKYFSVGFNVLNGNGDTSGFADNAEIQIQLY